MGLAYPAAASDKSHTVVETLSEQGKIADSIFGFKLTQDPSTSIMTLGGVDEDLYEDIVYAPVIQYDLKGMWFIQLQGVGLTYYVNYAAEKSEFAWVNYCYDDEPCFGLVDTGTSYLYVSQTLFDDFRDVWLNYRSDHCGMDGSIYICQTTSLEWLPTFNLMINGKNVAIPPEAYTIAEGTTLKIAVSAGSETLLGPNYLLLGDAFIRSYYTVFDQKENRVGFGSEELFEEAMIRPSHEYYGLKFYISFCTGSIIVGLSAIFSTFRFEIPQRGESPDSSSFQRSLSIQR